MKRTPCLFPDHHQFTAQDFEQEAFSGSSPIVMTEKDGIKCESFADDRFWTLDVLVQADSALLMKISEHVREFYID